MRTGLAVLIVLLAAGTAFSQNAEKPLLSILTDTGQVRDGLPVLAPHPDEKRIVRELSRGFVLTMTRLYRGVQVYLQPGTPPEPAYLLFSRNQGGFPRFGFYLEGASKRGVGYVDLYATKLLAGRFGAVDQIFPHELGHVIMRLLAGEPGPGGSNQLHAIGVRTDPRLAYQEGFAEHLQIMAVDDPGADPATRALSSDGEQLRLAERNLWLYRRELQARWSFATPKRVGFLTWFGATEQVLRYHAVKANAFARAPDVPDRLLVEDPYLAYLLVSVVPGDAGEHAKPAGAMLSTEGVVATLFYRWVTSGAIASRYVDDEFYERFGRPRQAVSPTENAYLKLFHAIRTHKPQTAAEAVRAYTAVYPEESAAVDALLSATLLGRPLPAAPAIWLANRQFCTGTSLYDQYRSIPSVHTFDLNAATEIDLVGVPGVDRTTAAAILASGPYSSVRDLQRVKGVSPAVLEQFRTMESDMRHVGSDGEEGFMSKLPYMIWAYAWRALAALALSAAAGAVLFRRVRGKGWLRSVVSALAVSFITLALGWTVMGAEGMLGYALGVSIFALPSALYLAARRRWAQILPAVLAWSLAAVPAKALTWPLF